MKKVLMAVGFAALLAIPATATGDDPAPGEASEVSAAGPAGAASAAGANADAAGANRLRVRFRLRSRNGRPVAIKRFRFRRLRATCNAGAVINVHGNKPHMGVNRKKRFRGRIARRNAVVRIKGRVYARRVVGTIRVVGDIAGATGCRSGVVRWRARLR